MAVNKVDLNGETVLDLTTDTVTPETLAAGVMAHNARGEKIIGTYVDKECYAFIVVSYSSGSTCTCTNGSTVLTATDTSGVYVFAIPEAGSWTVSISSTAHPTPVAKTVSITSYGQSVGVTLAYIRNLLSYDNKYPNNSGGWVQTTVTKLWGEYSSVAATANGNGLEFPSATSIMTTNWSQDLSAFNSLYVNVPASSRQITVSVMKSLGGEMGYKNSNVLAQANIDGTSSQFRLDVSAVNDNCYIVIGVGSTFTATVAQVWLEA